jgi:hypothetical protein
MAPKSSDAREKATAAGVQLQQALMSASEALKTIAEIVPSLFPQSEQTAAPKTTTSTSPEVNQTEPIPPASNKRKRKEKDPDAPEKPPSAYHLYAKEKRDQIRAAMPGQPTANDVVHEINRLWKGLNEESKKVRNHFLILSILLTSQPFVDAAEKLKSPYKQALAEYERKKTGQSDDKTTSEAPKKPTEPAPPTKNKSTPAKGGFTAVRAPPLVVGPDNELGSGDDSEDEAAVAADLGGSQPPVSTSPSKRQRKDTTKHSDGDSGKKEKEKTKEKEKDKDRRRRRKTGKADS